MEALRGELWPRGTCRKWEPAVKLNSPVAPAKLSPLFNDFLFLPEKLCCSPSVRV